jgi:hypothetical protein
LKIQLEFIETRKFLPEYRKIVFFLLVGLSPGVDFKEVECKAQIHDAKLE